MAISLRCVCGAVLEIDDKFLGRKIPCPDCNRILDTNPPAAPPKVTSAWALAALVLPLAGMLTLIGPVAGIVCGMLGLRHIQRDPSVGGRNFARAGIVLGGLFSLLSLFALLAGEFFNLDGFLRVFLAPRDLPAQKEMYVWGTPTPQESATFALKLPGRGWGKVPIKNSEEGIELILINPWLDLQAICFALAVDAQDDVRIKAIQRFLETGLAKDLNRDPEANLPFPTPEQIKSVGEEGDKGASQFFEVELAPGRIPRVFLFRVFLSDKTRLNVAVVGCRKTRFPRYEEELHKMLESVKVEELKNNLP